MSAFFSVYDARLPDNGIQRWGRLYGSAIPLAIANALDSSTRPVLLLTADVRAQERLEAELRFFSPKLPLLQFPDLETLPYDIFSPHQDIVSGRLATLARLPHDDNPIVIAPATTLLQRLPPHAYIAGSTLVCRVGQQFDLDSWRTRLSAAGYRHVSQVMEHGEFAVRGSLIDIFPMGVDDPVRIDLFDDEIETIRSFDSLTQISGPKVDSLQILPAREFPMTEEGIRGFRQRYRRRFEGDPTKVQLYREVSDGHIPGGLEYYLPLFFDETVTLLDYLPDHTVVLTDDDIEETLTQLGNEIADRYEQRAHDRERPLLSPTEAFADPTAVAAHLQRFTQVRISTFEQVDEAVNFASHTPPRLEIRPRQQNPAAALQDFVDNFDGRILFAAESAGHRETLAEFLRGRGMRVPRVDNWRNFASGEQRLALIEAPLERGLLLQQPAQALIVEEQLFGERVRTRRRRRPSRDPAAIVRDLTDLHAGAPVVHEEYGVGRFIGLQTLEVAGETNEFLTLEYADGDKLYVPVHALDRISRYTGAAADGAPLHRLGSDQWDKARRKAAEKIRDAAAELLDVYARREARPGRTFAPAADEYSAFVQAFPFDETDDQASAIDAVVDDLHSSRPMDRVICGDVGFGKTEVAMRAAFVAVAGGAQVAMLVPTTLLAQQHLQSFRDRFADWPVRIESLSRFRSGKETTQILQGMADGKVDIVIGTHKLLQRQVEFRDLGLVIIDEEHRFGVRHKEKLKELRTEVDVLTLTATPIPRTLNMAMGGVRDLSLITTPPSERHAVKTFVTEWNDTLLREAVLREIRRGGQVFVVHNRVQSIGKLADKLEKLVPEADMRIAHGQMRERELEQVMLDFYHRRFNVLICTTIVESGLDVPTANTIIIDRAEQLGLAQLHQLRGRVGRSHHRAYAYLITPPRRGLTADAVKRLEAVESTEELGAGFMLATHDLEIRGAGELLGEDQSGQIHEIGFSMYIELLERAVRAIREGTEPDLLQPLSRGADIDLQEPALLPDDYLPDVHMRLVLYKRIASAPDEDALRELQVEMIDRFGLLPDPAKRLFAIARLRIAAAPLGISRIVAGSAGGNIEFDEDTEVDPYSLIVLVQKDPQRYRLDGPTRLRFSDAPDSFDDRVDYLAGLLSGFSLRSSEEIV
ncbi:MAG: transcription-repair coupling factor [Gammaproteobacteria bacterium]|nr:transcription-repair coupling factor [Gammaproteobacteria bacterium]